MFLLMPAITALAHQSIASRQLDDDHQSGARYNLQSLMLQIACQYL